VNGLISAACDNLHDNPIVLSGNPDRPIQEHDKNRMDAINNNGQVVPVTPLSVRVPESAGALPVITKARKFPNSARWRARAPRETAEPCLLTLCSGEKNTNQGTCA